MQLFPVRRFHHLTILLVALLAGSGAVSRTHAADVIFYAVSKQHYFIQTNSAAAFERPVDTINFNYPWNAGATVFITPTGAVNSAFVGPSGSPDQELTADGPDNLNYSGDYLTQAAMDADVPNGTYTMLINTANDGSKTANLTISGNTYPNAPHVSDFNQAQTINPVADFALTWDAFTGALATDFILVEIRDEFDNTVFSTPYPNQAGALAGTNRSLVIPVGTLSESSLYWARILFIKVSSKNTTAYAGVPGYAAYIASTEVPLATSVPVNPPEIITQPTNQIAVAGGAVSFLVEALSDTPPTYQWRKNATNLVGQTNAVLTLNPVTTNSAGIYSVVVANTGGSVTSSNATLSVLVLPTVTAGPTNRTVLAGSNVLFAVTVTGTAPFSYQWRFNSNSIAGATNLSYIVTNAQPTNAGFYSVQVANAAGVTNSTNATLVVNVKPSITAQPTNLVVIAGGNALFSVTADGTSPLRYQWRKGTTNYVGQTNATLSLANVTSNSAGGFYVVVTNIAGSVTSATATLTVLLPPAITAGPTNRTIGAGSNALFAVTVTGTAPFLYQWRFNSNALAAATNASLVVTNARATNAGFYSVIVSNAAGVATSTNATLTVNSPPTITTQPTNQTVLVGSSVSFLAVAAGSPTLKYQWRLNGTNVLNQTNASLTLVNAQLTNAGNYTLRVTNSFGSVTSAVAVLSVVTSSPPVITQQPQSLTLPPGTNAMFSVIATGPNLTYLWSKDASPLAGKTDPTLTLTNLQVADSGVYRVTVGNASSNVLSAPATLVVLPSLQIQAAGTNVLLSWPVGTLGFSLETSVALGASFAVTNPPLTTNVVAQKIQTMMPSGSGQQLFRLRR